MASDPQPRDIALTTIRLMLSEGARAETLGAIAERRSAIGYAGLSSAMPNRAETKAANARARDIAGRLAMLFGGDQDTPVLPDAPKPVLYGMAVADVYGSLTASTRREWLGAARRLSRTLRGAGDVLELLERVDRA